MKRAMLAVSVGGMLLWGAVGLTAGAGDNVAATTSTKKTRKKTATTTATAATTAKKGPQPTANATAAQIAAAKASGQVWVNTTTGVWHTSSSKWYGATKQGKFMSQADAAKAGYHAAKGGE